MKFLITATLLSFHFTTGFGQTKDLSTLPTYDCSLKKLMSIIGTKTIIVTGDNARGVEAIVNDYCSSFGNNCVLKQETGLTKTDYLNPLFIVGELKSFKAWERFDLPVKKLANGFEINNRKFTDSSDGFAFVDTTHIVVAGNSLEAVKDIQLAVTGGHDILVMQKGKITFFGNYKDSKYDLYNLQNLKASNYNKKVSDLFSGIYVSKTFKEKVDFEKTQTALKSYTRKFASIYKIKAPTRKINWVLHSNMQEYGTMSGMFGLTCPGNNSAGFSIRGEIHTNGYDLGLVKHEYSHFLFDNTIPQDNNPAFFIEGCVEYVTDLNDSLLYKKRLAVAKQYKDTLNYHDLIVDNKDFYGQYSEVNYKVCGVFVKYIIDAFGVEVFKSYCLAKNKEAAAPELFKMDFLWLINGYKNWLEEQESL